MASGLNELEEKCGEGDCCAMRGRGGGRAKYVILIFEKAAKCANRIPESLLRKMFNTQNGGFLV